MNRLQAQLGERWHVNPRQRVAHNNKIHAPVVLVVALGNAAELSGYLRLFRALDAHDVHVLAFALPDNLRQMNEALALRIPAIERLAGERSIQLAGNSAGADINVYTAKHLLARGHDVVSLWNDAPYLTSEEHFTRVALRGAAELLQPGRSAKEASHFIKYYFPHLIKRLATSEFCAQLNPIENLSLLNKAGIPILFTHGRRDHMVSAEAIKKQIEACTVASIVTAVELSTGHTAWSRFDSAMAGVCEQWLAACERMAPMGVADRAQQFQSLVTQPLSLELPVLSLR